MSEKAILNLPDKKIELPIITGTANESAIDISQLRSETGYITLDPGFGNTGSCESNITYLNGEKGILKYRGHSIETLAEKSSFLEVSYLLLNGSLPTLKQLSDFRAQINDITTIPQGIQELITTFPKDAHPMGVLSAATVGLSAYFDEFLSPDLTEKQIEKVVGMLLAFLPVIASRIYRHSQSLEPVNSKKEFKYAEDFLNLMFNSSSYKIDPKAQKALDVLFILHADHEQNCSASSVRVVGSGKSNVFAAMSAGMNALWGPLHGGANQAVIEMLDSILKDGGDAGKYIDKAKDKNDPFRLMGFGHRVYKNFDPRARIIKSYCDEVLSDLGIKDPILDIAKNLEKAALNDSYFQERKLYPNVDFYSGIIYRALGIPTNMFTVMFVIGRLPGWLSQWKELRLDNKTRISRPRQVYQGEVDSKWVAIEKR